VGKSHCPHCGAQWDMQMWPGMSTPPDLTDMYAVTLCWTCEKPVNVRFVMGVMTVSLPSAEDVAAYENRADVQAMRAGVRKAKNYGT
jgi:hypothetical protein